MRIIFCLPLIIVMCLNCILSICQFRYPRQAYRVLSELMPYAIENCELQHQARLFLVLAQATLACCRGTGPINKHKMLLRRVVSFLGDAADRFLKAEEYFDLRECLYLKAFVHDKLNEVHIWHCKIAPMRVL